MPAEEGRAMSQLSVSFETTGGLAGLTIAKTIDSDKLLAEHASQLRQLVNASNFFSLPTTIPYRGPIRDFFHYKLIVELDDKKHSIEVDEPAAPSELKPLLQWLRTFKPR
jgi:hypothetical protein